MESKESNSIASEGEREGRENRARDKTTSVCAAQSEESPSSYVYSALRGSRTIRLLKPVPGSALTFELLPVDIHKAPPYLAISYTWGSPTSRATITIDGRSISVPKNLADALNGICDYVKKHGLMLWADSVCINQADLQERSHQVSFMHAIYRCAECVGIWLGESADMSDLIMEKMVEWHREVERLSESLADNWELAVTTFLELTRRTWWRRAWIVQEAAALGSSRTLLFCGPRMINWSALRTALHVIIPVEFRLRDLFLTQITTAISLDRFRYCKERGAFVRLFTVLELIRPFECQDPRDKLYASLGLAADISETDIVVDYGKSVEDVYTDIARFSLSQTGPSCLDFLGLVAQGTQEVGGALSGLPSWFPDLRIHKRMYAFERYLDVFDFEGLRAYNAGGDGKGLSTIDGNCLRVHGYILDSIEKISPVFHRDLSDNKLSIERLLRPENEWEAYPSGGTIMEAFDHTLLADIGRPLLEHGFLKRGMKVDWTAVDQDPEKLTPAQTQRRDRMVTDIKRATFGRRLIMTRSGLIGLGPGLAEGGDLVCVLFGGHVLYVLRKKFRSPRYQFVGECYVHGMMDGEALKTSAQQREFVIV